MSDVKISQLSLSAAALKALHPNDRSALLLLGLCLNEANWLRKLLWKSANAISDEPEGKARFGLVVLTATTLAGKIYEGWGQVGQGSVVAPVIGALTKNNALKALRKELNRRTEKGSIIETIRNKTHAFHYNAPLDFSRLESIDDQDATVLLGPYGGDVFLHVSSLVSLEPLIALDTNPDYRVALKNVLSHISDTVGLYCDFLQKALIAMIVEKFPNRDHLQWENLADTVAEDPTGRSLSFFTTPPQEHIDRIGTGGSS